jgi:bile acid:Na+ symporter, BASS family
VDLAIVDVIVSVVLGLIMFGVGLSMSKGDFILIFRTPKKFIFALLSQMIILPIIAFSICLFAPISPLYKIGLIALAAAPGGTTAGFISYLFKGNLGLSVTLTVVNSILSILSIPLILNMATLFFIEKDIVIKVPIFETFSHIGLIIGIPIWIGILLKKTILKLFPDLLKKLKIILSVMLFIIFFIKFFAPASAGGSGITILEIKQILPYALLLNFSCLIMGFLIMFLNNYNKEDCMTVGVESGVHNTTMAFLISSSILHNNEIAKPALIYAMFSFWTALIFCYLVTTFFKRYFNSNTNSIA